MICDADIDFKAWESAKFRRFSSKPEGVRIRSHVGALAERMYAQNVKLAVVSNSSRDEVSFLLGASGLDRFFAHVIFHPQVEAETPIAGAQYLSPAKDLWPVLQENLVMDSNGAL